MNIPSVSPSLDTPYVQAVAPSDAAGASQRPASVDGDGDAATWWVSPPGQFFSILHEIGQRYPVELTAALASFGDAVAAEPLGAGTHPTTPPGASPAPAVRRRRGLEYGPPGPLTHAALLPPVTSTAPLAPSSPLARLVATMARLAGESPETFGAIATGISSSVLGVAASGAGDEGLATLAAQLAQSAQVAAAARRPEPHAGTCESQVDPVGPVAGIDAQGYGRGVRR